MTYKIKRKDADIYLNVQRNLTPFKTFINKYTTHYTKEITLEMYYGTSTSQKYNVQFLFSLSYHRNKRFHNRVRIKGYYYLRFIDRLCNILQLKVYIDVSNLSQYKVQTQYVEIGLSPSQVLYQTQSYRNFHFTLLRSGRVTTRKTTCVFVFCVQVQRLLFVNLQFSFGQTEVLTYDSTLSLGLLRFIIGRLKLLMPNYGNLVSF